MSTNPILLVDNFERKFFDNQHNKAKKQKKPKKGLQYVKKQKMISKKRHSRNQEHLESNEDEQEHLESNEDEFDYLQEPMTFEEKFPHILPYYVGYQRTFFQNYLQEEYEIYEKIR